MWTHVRNVARLFLFDSDKFYTFAMANAETYRIDGNEVSSWGVEALINDFKASLPAAEITKDRKKQLRKQGIVFRN